MKTTLFDAAAIVASIACVIALIAAVARAEILQDDADGYSWAEDVDPATLTYVPNVETDHYLDGNARSYGSTVAEAEQRMAAMLADRVAWHTERFEAHGFNVVYVGPLPPVTTTGPPPESTVSGLIHFRVQMQGSGGP